MKVLFLDTNVLLQCRDLAELPWDELSGGRDLRLLIPRPVQQEVDRLKHDGNSRRAQRARKISSLIRDVVLSNDETWAVRTSPPRVNVAFPPITNLGPEHPLLDYSRADDRIIAETLAYKEANSTEDVSLLTNDTNMMLTAKRCNLPFIAVPEEWLLPPEPDTRDKKIAQLESKIKELEKSSPEIEIFAETANVGSVTELEIVVVNYRGLTEEKVNQTILELKRAHPLVTEFSTSRGSSAGLVRTPTKEAIETYQEVDYPKWIQELTSFFQGLPERLSRRSKRVNFYLSNAGRVPAEHVLVHFKCFGGLLLDTPPSKNEEDARSKEIRLPSPPKPPKGRSMADDYLLLGSSYRPLREYSPPLIPTLPLSRDRNGFYWKPRRPAYPSEAWAFECEEFRHQEEAESFPVDVLVPPDFSRSSGLLECSVTARNLAQPSVFRLPVKVRYTEVDIMEKVHILLRKRVLEDDDA